MKWLTILDDSLNLESIKNILKISDSKCSIKNFEISDFSVQKSFKDNFSNYAAALIFSNEKTLQNINDIFFVTGFFYAKSIPVITNIKEIQNLYASKNSEKNGIYFSKSPDDFFLENKKLSSIIKNSSKRLSKDALLERGIPFTSDCFASYIAKNKEEIFNEFICAGMDVNARDDMGVPMLNIACRNDNFEMAETLLDLGAELNAVSDDRGYTAVMDAVWRGNEKITKFLISKGADLNTISKEGQSNLILAVGANRPELCQILAEAGADPDIKDMMGMSAYSYANLFRKQTLVDILKPYHKEF